MTNALRKNWRRLILPWVNNSCSSSLLVGAFIKNLLLELMAAGKSEQLESKSGKQIGKQM
jgi:hypothetical protein